MKKNIRNEGGVHKRRVGSLPSSEVEKGENPLKDTRKRDRVAFDP